MLCKCPLLAERGHSDYIIALAGNMNAKMSKTTPIKVKYFANVIAFSSFVLELLFNIALPFSFTKDTESNCNIYTKTLICIFNKLENEIVYE